MLVIVGMPRSGSISLHQYLINRFGVEHVKRDECMFREDAVRYFKSRWGNMATPIIIFRNNVDRCWSWYHYIKPDIEYTTFLKKPYRTHGMGEMNPIKQCNMKKFITPWLELKPQFFSFEEMILDPDFPKMNEGNTPPIMPTHVDITRELLRKELCKG